jgi:hypothetical protein
MKVEKQIRVNQSVLCCDRCQKHDKQGGAVIVQNVVLTQTVPGSTASVIVKKGDLCQNCIAIVAARFARQPRAKKEVNPDAATA